MAVLRVPHISNNELCPIKSMLLIELMREVRQENSYLIAQYDVCFSYLGIILSMSGTKLITQAGRTYQSITVGKLNQKAPP